MLWLKDYSANRMKEMKRSREAILPKLMSKNKIYFEHFKMESNNKKVRKKVDLSNNWY